MGFLNMNTRTLLVFLVGLAIVAGFEFLVKDNGSLMYCLTFFIAVSQGPIAIIAATEIAGTTWAKPYKRELLSVRHMMLFLAGAFVIFLLAGKLHLYTSWMEGEHHHKWLNPTFFSIRNVVLLLFGWVVANKYAAESLVESEKKTRWALFWVFTYVVSQTVFAFDWVMSLDYPWISTLFGGYFFIEAFYSGLALAAVFTFFHYSDFIKEFTEARFKKAQMDMMTLMFGFSVFWAYLFFSQYLVIWYGNIPEEVGWMVARVREFGNLLYLVILIMFVIPFVTMLFRKVKGNPRAVVFLGALVWVGLLMERYFMIRPRMNLHPVITAIEFVVIGLVFLVAIRDTRQLTPAG